jgi:intracellular septation protein
LHEFRLAGFHAQERQELIPHETAARFLPHHPVLSSAFKVWNIYVATGVAIVATIAQIAWLRHKNGKVEPMQWLSLGVIVLFGGATIVAHNETFIKWKPTVLYWLMAGTLARAALLQKNLLEIPDGFPARSARSRMARTNWSWITFFAAMGVINLWVAFNFDTDTWVNFKLFGGWA